MPTKRLDYPASTSKDMPKTQTDSPPHLMFDPMDDSRRLETPKKNLRVNAKSLSLDSCEKGSGRG